MAVTTSTRQRVRGDVVRIVNRGLPLAEFTTAVTRSLQRAVPGDGSCLLTIDPATLLPTGEIVDNGLPPPAMARMAEIEIGEPDFNKLADLGRSGGPAASLSEATAGDLDRSLRQREVRRPSGFGDELRVALTDGTATWGALTVLRQAGAPHFTATEVRFLASLAGVLADGVRRALLGSIVADDESGTGLLVLAPDGSVELANREADHWIGALSHLPEHAAPLPSVIHAVADRARRCAGGADTDGRPSSDPDLARARVRAGTGQWVVVRGSALGDGPDARVAVQLEAARGPELARLIVEAYGFTERERMVTELVAQGRTTSEIAARLGLVPYTVQDHLKSIFDKSGAGSRGELVARLFFDHYAPGLAAVPPPTADRPN